MNDINNIIEPKERSLWSSLFAEFRAKSDRWKIRSGLGLGLLVLLVFVYNGHIRSNTMGISASQSDTKLPTLQQTLSKIPPQQIAPKNLRLDDRNLIMLVLLTNIARAGTVPILAQDPALNTVAKTRAEHLCAVHQTDHKDWENSFKGLNYQYHGENLAWGYYPDVKKAEEELFASPEHKANIMDKHFHSIGIGYAPDCKMIVELYGGQEDLVTKIRQ